MFHASLRKHLLLAALALMFLVFDTVIGDSRRSPNQTQEVRSPKKTPAKSEPAPKIDQLPALSPSPADGASLAATKNSAEDTLSQRLAQQLQDIEDDYKAVSQPIYDHSTPLISPDDRSKLAYLDQEKLRDLSQVLTPTELEIYQNTTNEAAAPKRR